MKTFMRYASKCISVLLVLFLVFNLYFVVSAKVQGGTPKVLGKELMVVLSGSMSPVFETGSLIAVDPSGPAKLYSKGDVITFKSPEDPTKIITHRVADVINQDGQRLYVTKGDANQSKDPKPVPPINVIGQYAYFHIPWLGYVLSFVKSKFGIALFLIIPGVLLIGGQLISMFRMLDKPEAKTEAAAATEGEQESEAPAASQAKPQAKPQA